MTDLSLLFRAAWRSARADAAIYGIPLRVAFSAALRSAWAGSRRPRRVDLSDVVVAIGAELRAQIASGRPVGTDKPWDLVNAVEGRGPAY